MCDGDGEGGGGGVVIWSVALDRNTRGCMNFEVVCISKKPSVKTIVKFISFFLLLYLPYLGVNRCA